MKPPIVVTISDGFTPARRAERLVQVERRRQEAKCAEKRAEGLQWLTCADPRMPEGDKLAVLMEEVGEVAREICDARAESRRPSENLLVELVQVAAVAVAWAESELAESTTDKEST